MPIGGTAFFGMNQHPRITTTYLNQLNRHGDPGPGLNVGGDIDRVNGGQVGFSGMIAQPYYGFAGGKLTITNPWAGTQTVPQQFPGFADPAVGPLYGGIYQYVRVDPTDTTTLFRGQIVFWSDELNYIVSGIGIAGGVNRKIAGVAVNETFPSYWDFFQIAGIASVFFPAAGSINQFAIVTPSASAAATVATSATITINSIGMTVLAAPTAGNVSTVELNILQGWNF
jgi:hypothetical protein